MLGNIQQTKGKDRGRGIAVLDSAKGRVPCEMLELETWSSFIHP